MASLFTFGKKFLLRDGKPIVRNDLITGSNAAAIGGYAKWNGGYNFTSVGTNGRASAYGTFDQTGNCFEWMDGNNTSKVIRGGDIYGLGSRAGGYEATKFTRYIKTVNGTGASTNRVPFVVYPRNYAGGPGNKDWGGRIASSGNPLNLSNYVTVGDPGNSADTTGYGAVSYQYQINKYLLTNDEYCAFLNSVDTTPTVTTTKDIAYGLSNDNIIYEINMTDITAIPVFYTNLVNNVITNALSFDTDNKYLYFLDREHNLYSWDLGSTMTVVGNVNTIGSLGIPPRGPYEAGNPITCAAYYNGAIWVFNSAPGSTTQLVKINLSYSSGKPSISSINKYTTNISGINNNFGDIAIDNNGILYASTPNGQLYTLDVNNPNNSYTLIKNKVTPPQFPDVVSGYQLSFGRNYETLYLHDYGSGSWYTVDKSNGTMSLRLGITGVGPLIIPWGLTGGGFRDICGPHNIILSEMNGRRTVYSPQMNSERVGGILRTFNRNTNTYSYSVKPNYGNKPVYFLSWFDLARYCNWLHNNYGSLETGAYTLNNAGGGSIITKNAGAKYYIPSENEWYKAAYYKGGSTNAGYWTFATRSDTTPTEVYASSKGDGTIKLINTNPSTSGNVSVMSLASNVSITGIIDVVHNITLSLNFDSIENSGTIKISPSTAYGIPPLPTGFYIDGAIAQYNISSNVPYSGSNRICFTLPDVMVSGDFMNTKVFYREGSQYGAVDTTVTSGLYSQDYSNRTICSIASGLGDFYLITQEIPWSSGNIAYNDPESSGTAYTIPIVSSPTGSPSVVAGANSATVTVPTTANTGTTIIRVVALLEDSTCLSTLSNIADPNPIIVDNIPVSNNVTFITLEQIPEVGVSSPSPSSDPISITDTSPYPYIQSIGQPILISWE